MKHWIEAYHVGNLKPGLQDITEWRQEEIGKLVAFFDDFDIPWAFGCGKRMPDELPPTPNIPSEIIRT